MIWYLTTTSVFINTINFISIFTINDVDIDCRETNNWWGAGSPIGEEDVGTCGRPFRDWYGSWYDFFADVASYYKYNLTIKKGKLFLIKRNTEIAVVQMPKQLELCF